MASFHFSLTILHTVLVLQVTLAKQILPTVQLQHPRNFRRDDSFVSPDPETFSVSGNCDYVWTSMLDADGSKAQLYTPDGLEQINVIPGWVNDFALGAATVGLLNATEWQPQIWAWTDETSGDTLVRVELQSGPVIISDALPLGQNENPGCYQYFGYATPNSDGEPETLYMALLEKALAVSNGGSYEALNDMTASDAFLALTGQSGTVVEGTAGSADESLASGIADAIESNKPCVVDFISPSDLTAFSEYDPDTDEVKLSIGTLKAAVGFEGTIEFTSGSTTYYFMGDPIVYVTFKAADNGVYFYNVGQFNLGTSDPDYGLLLPVELLPYIVKSITTWNPSDDSGNVARDVSISKRATQSVINPELPDPSLLHADPNPLCEYSYSTPPIVPVYDPLALTKANVAEGALPECAIGAAALALMEAKQFTPRLERCPVQKIVYGDFYTDNAGTKKRVYTDESLIMGNDHCYFPFVGYQAIGGSIYMPYYEKLLAVLLDNNPSLRPVNGRKGSGYNGIAFIPTEFVLQTMTGKQVSLKQNANDFAYHALSPTVKTLMPSTATSSAPKTAVVWATRNPPSSYTVTLPGGGKAKITMQQCPTGQAWKVSIPKQKDVMVFARHAYAVNSYNSATNMFTLSNPFPWNYDTNCKKVDGATLQVHASVMDVFGLEIDWVKP